MFVLAVGTAFDGLTLVGPFIDYTDAVDYAMLAYPNLCSSVETMTAPDTALALRAAVIREKAERLFTALDEDDEPQSSEVDE